jgi:uncharacterized protein YjbI with pentapeptide repeats
MHCYALSAILRLSIMQRREQAMEERFRSWWQIVRKSLAVVGIIVACVLGITLLVVIALAYIFNVNIPGLHGKTLWDWLQLLIIPLVLAVIALLFNRATTRTEQKIAADRYQQDIEIASRHYHEDRHIAERRYQNDRRIALDKQREDLLQSYLDRMSELLLKEKLRSSEVDAEVRDVARVRTITILFQLDARRIGYVFAFLRQTGLMSTTPNDSIVSLKSANLEKINFSQANLFRTDLSGAGLSLADLSLADLSGADLSGADLSEANLIRANLSEANLLIADLSEAWLSGADFRGADLSEANLSGANLSEANLSRARVTEEQLAKAKSLRGATLPDGSKHP